MPFDLALSRAKANEANMREAYRSLTREARRDMALADLDRAVAGGYEGAASDSVLESSPWGFEPRRIRDHGIFTTLWHGNADEDVPVAVAHHLIDEEFGAGGASATPNLFAARIIEGESHTLIRRHWNSILNDVVANSTGAPEVRINDSSKL